MALQSGDGQPSDDRLWEADLIDYRAGGGWYRIKRLGPRYASLLP
jgi:hypothetical protein